MGKLTEALGAGLGGALGSLFNEEGTGASWGKKLTSWLPFKDGGKIIIMEKKNQNYNHYLTGGTVSKKEYHLMPVGEDRNQSGEKEKKRIFQKAE